jgi:Lrp/AsnC family transcriptional regulator, regulator for asnA, asnC and gidA
MSRKQLDETDRRIIQHLREDGRRSYAAIARDVGLSEASVRQRVTRLLRQKIIHIAAATYPTSLGFITAGIGIKVEGARHEEVAHAIAELPQAEYVAVCVGVFDVVVDVICESRDELYEVVVGHIRALPGVRDAQIYLYTKVVHDQLAWRPPVAE